MHSLDQSPARGHRGVRGLPAIAVARGSGLAACGGSSNSSFNASARVVNATLTHPSIDLPVSAAAVYSESALNLPGNAVCTLFMVGDAGTPMHVLRRSR